MANTMDTKSQNQPGHDAPMKGGHTQQGSADGSRSQTQQSNANPMNPKDDHNKNQPSHDSQVKGGQQSHSGGNK